MAKYKKTENNNSGNTPNYGKKFSGRPASDIDQQPTDQMALSKQNFIYIGIAGVMIVVGFLLMLGPSSSVENFEPDIFSARRILWGPLCAFLGFVAMAIAIIVTPKTKKH